MTEGVWVVTMLSLSSSSWVECSGMAGRMEAFVYFRNGKDLIEVVVSVTEVY